MNKNSEFQRYPSEVLTVSDQGFTKHYFIEGQRIARRLGEAFVGDLAALVKADPLEALYRSLPELPDFAVDRLVRDFDCLGADYRNFYPGETFLDGLERALTAEAYTENDIYFYHSDHLGSSSFITDINGDATQHLQYTCTVLAACVPFGEDWVHQQNTAAYYTPFTFSGKERDMETGLSYFGARYYEPSLSIWLSVDPMSDEAPGWTPYRYCFWNPMKYADRDGKFETNIGGDPPAKLDIAPRCPSPFPAPPQPAPSTPELIPPYAPGQGPNAPSPTPTNQPGTQTAVNNTDQNTAYDVEKAVNWLNNNAHGSWRDVILPKNPTSG